MLRLAIRQRNQQLDLKAFTVVYDTLIPDRERYYAGLAAASLGIPIDYVPTINESGKIALTILNSMTAAKSLGDISQDLTQQFPHRFATVAKALSHAVDLTQKYS